MNPVTVAVSPSIVADLHTIGAQCCHRFAQDSLKTQLVHYSTIFNQFHVASQPTPTPKTRLTILVPLRLMAHREQQPHQSKDNTPAKLLATSVSAALGPTTAPNSGRPPLSKLYFEACLNAHR